MSLHGEVAAAARAGRPFRWTPEKGELMMSQTSKGHLPRAFRKPNAQSRHGETCGSVDHKIHRRQFLEGMAAGALSVCSFSGLFSVPAFAAQAKKEQKHCILLWL